MITTYDLTKLGNEKKITKLDGELGSIQFFSLKLGFWQ